MLVNIVDCVSADLEECGSVALAFLQAGGRDISEDFDSVEEGSVRVSHMTSTLDCNLLMHMTVREWREHNSGKVIG